MTARAVAVSVSFVTDPDAHWITVDIRAGDPFEGRLHCPDGSVRAFTGWLGLAREIQAALGTHQPQGDHRVDEVP